jgi:enoyl-CoA hydratase/carnithine racemase/methionyl-tRNA formyltransferase
LQAVEEFDAGPVWAFEQFPVDIDAPDATKSNLYRGPVTRAALAATLAAIDRIDAAAAVQPKSATDDSHPTTSESATNTADASTSHRGRTSTTDRCDVSQQTSPDPGATTAAGGISPRLTPDPSYRTTSVTMQAPFLGGATHHRPLLKAAQRDFDVHTHTAREISRRIRCADSQPGCLTRVFGGVNLYVYGGTVEEGHDVLQRQGQQAEPGSIIACRGEAVCVATCDGKGIWVNHVRRLKRRCDAMLWPKVPAVSGLRELGLSSDDMFKATRVPRATNDWSRAAHSTSQDVWVEFAEHPQRAAYVYFEFYNGAMSTDQCSELLEALAFVASTHSVARPLGAVVLMGGASYFSNGIALNVIEAAADPSLESWRNINRIDDVVQVLLEDFPQRGIATVAAIRGNCAAGGVALAAACDVVIAGSEAVLNPAYRALGLYGSEFHSLSYPGRCGSEGARHLLRDMLPLSAYGARAMGLVDHALPGHGAVLERRVRNHVRAMLASPYTPGRWKAAVRELPLAVARAQELGEMAKDFWSPRAERYHSRRREFVRKVRATQTPLRFAAHRRGRGGRLLDEEEADAFDDAAAFERRALERIRAEVERQAAVPLSPTDSGIQMDDAMSPVMGGLGLTRKDRKDMGPVFTCYYEGATA